MKIKMEIEILCRNPNNQKNITQMQILGFKLFLVKLTSIAILKLYV
jgi:hypothetical protein